MFVGHTHCDLDQMFSRFCVAINKAYLTGTYDDMDTLIRQSYSPNPLMVKMEETTDGRHCVAARCFRATVSASHQRPEPKALGHDGTREGT